MTNQTRLIAADASKGIAIFLVIWGHVLQQGLISGASGLNPMDNVVFKVIYSFHMPLFMMISGYFFTGSLKKNIREGVLLRVKQMLIPLVIWNTIHYLLVLLFRVWNKVPVSISIREYVDELTTGYWFFCILLYALVVGLGARIFKGRYPLLGIILLTPILLISPVRWNALTQYPFFLAGFFFHYCRRDKEYNAGSAKYICTILFAGLMAAVFLLRRDAVGVGIVKTVLDAGLTMLKTRNITVFGTAVINYGMSLLLGFLGGLAVILWLRDLEKKGCSRVLGVLAKLGAVSMPLYILQRIFVEFLAARLYNRFVESTGNNPIIANMTIFTFILSLMLSVLWTVLLYYLVKILTKNKAGRLILNGRS